MSNDPASRMMYIQNLFLQVQTYMQRNPALPDVEAYLQAEAPEFRSVAYESASMELALHDFSSGVSLTTWKQLYAGSGQAHSFHMDIGLGWALAKTGRAPETVLSATNGPAPRMVLDGMGYFFGLFKGRKTVRHQMVPDGIEGTDLQGFDQGLGRRLWYIAHGDVTAVTQLMRAFPEARHPALWRGTGIACGYVGGKNDRAALLQLLSNAGKFGQQLRTGIALVAISRRVSGSMTPDIETACQVLCNRSSAEIVAFATDPSGMPVLPKGQDYTNWLSQLETLFDKKENAL
ncbi:MAG: DUF1702 family protein [Lewinellaceae bacterium]|nr:DUF1702 family protein [Lewinellaceae bacterium]